MAQDKPAAEPQKTTPVGIEGDKPHLETEGEWSELAKTSVIAILLAIIIRTFLFEPFNIPSGSMYPTLKVGDYLFVSKYTYGYSKASFPFGLGGFEGRFGNSHTPQRGDVVVFKLPTDPRIDFIKRVIGLPGDKIQVINGQLYINDMPATREIQGSVDYDESGQSPHSTLSEYVQTLPEGQKIRIYEKSDNEPLDNTESFIVPEGHYFMMGDNRDNSQDSRVQQLVGFVPLDNIVGQAKFLFYSTNGSAAVWQVWKWPFTIRYDRLFRSISSVTASE